MIRVLHLVTIMNRAGQETFLMNVYRQSDRTKLQFGFLCSSMEEGDYDDEICKLGGYVYHFELNVKKGKLRHFDNYKRLVNEISKFREDYDIFHIHNYHAFDLSIEASAALKAGFQKVIIHSHSSFADEHLFLHKLFRHRIHRLPVKRLACSKEAGNWMYCNDSFTIISNGIDAEQFRFDNDVRLTVRKELALDDKFTIGHVGRFEQVKNHVHIVNVFKEFVSKYPNSVLLLVGDGHLYNQIKAFVEENGINDNVRFLGIREDVNRIYQAMDAFFFPSVYEGLGMVAIEAQAADLPCLLSSSIPNKVDITDNIIRCNLDAPLENWIDALFKIKQLSESRNRKDMMNIIRNSGFDSRTSVDELYNIYKSYRKP